MNTHNIVKKLINLESLPIETLTKEQLEELKLLKEMKKSMGDHDNEMYRKYGKTTNYYDRKGNKMSFWEWSGYCSDFEYKIIKQNTYGDFFVSTVWLGLDHGFLGSTNAPVIFETMIFIQDDREHELDGYQERYCIEEAAIKGHIEACELANNASGKDIFRDLKSLNQ